VIPHLKMPRMSGLRAAGEARPRGINALTVIMTGFGTVETAIDAMKRGAYDYVLKPFKLDEVIHVVQRGCTASSCRPRTSGCARPSPSTR
jgi:DNA-binding NtrC family response regulator